MEFEWLKDELKGNYLLCLSRYRSLFFRGTLSLEENGCRFWQPFPRGEAQEICGDLESAQRCCEATVNLAIMRNLSTPWPDMNPKQKPAVTG